MNEWIGLVGALGGTVIGGVITYSVTSQKYRYDRKIENQRRLITSCESIHELLSNIATQAATLNMGVIGDLGYSSPLKNEILKEKVQLDRLRMLVDFYAPSIQADVKAITDQFAIVSRSVAEVILQKDRTDEWKTKTVGTAAMASIQITKLAQDAQAKLGSVVRSTIAES